MRWMVVFGGLLVAGCVTTPLTSVQAPTELPRPSQLAPSELVDMTAKELLRALAERRTTSVAIVDALTARIAAFDDAGPQINAVIAVLPDARQQAMRLDAERAAGVLRGPLHGIPVLLKDNIAIVGQPTTAGSLALVDNIAAADAPLVAWLREAGTIILGRTNLSEWANIRSTNSTSGWSAVGGLTLNPWGAGRNACGSSSGSAAAVAAHFAPLAVGTETDGSITCPAGVNGVVGFKPSLATVSGEGIVPISHSQDTAGPMARTVAEAAVLYYVFSHSPLTASDIAQQPVRDSLRGTRVGVLRDRIGDDAEIVAAFDTALGQLRQAGATIVEIADSRSGLDGLGDAELVVLLAELKADMAAYLATTDPARVPSRTLADLIAFNKANPEELRYFDQDLFEQAQAGPTACAPNAVGCVPDKAYVDALAKSKGLAKGKLASLLADSDVSVLVGVTNGPAWESTLGKGDNFSGPSVSQIPAIAGAPHLTVPMALVRGLPVGLSFIGAIGDDARVLAYGHAFEQVRPALPEPPLTAGS